MGPKKIQKRVKKAMRAVRKRPEEEAVHNLRTGLRRCEALTRDKLPKRLRRLRKEAGRVRDLDVLRHLVIKLELPQQDANAADHLLEQLAVQRGLEVEKLEAAANKAKPAGVKRWINGHAQDPQDDLKGLERDVTDLFSDPAYTHLDENNLHAFRLRIKPVRYRAEMSADEAAQRTAERLNRLQSAIGDWHDLQMLIAFAERTLGPDGNAVVQCIRHASEKQFHVAMDEAARQRAAIAT
jgi:CHAD domain-containing protein